MSAAATARRQFIAKMNDIDVPVIGSLVWWNVRNVSITMKQLVSFLTECGLPPKYAREHNYRSSFIRALRELEEGRIISKVREDDNLIVYQFTAESLIKGDDKLEYTYETRVIVDKNAYFVEKDIEKALVKELPGVNGKPGYKADPKVTAKVVELFNRAKVTYTSGDVTRYIQNIFREEGDIISLREQGNIYFVPAVFQDLVQKVQNLVDKLGNSSQFCFLQQADNENSRATVGRAVLDELESVVKLLAEDVAAVDPGLSNQARMNWVESRLKRIQRVKQRIETYGNVIPEAEVSKLDGQVKKLAKSVLGSRKLSLAPEGE